MSQTLRFLPLLVIAGCSLVTRSELDDALLASEPLDLMLVASPAGVEGCGTSSFRFDTSAGFAGQDLSAELVVDGESLGAETSVLESTAGRAVATLAFDTTGLEHSESYAVVLEVVVGPTVERIELVLPPSGPTGFLDADGDGAGSNRIAFDCAGVLAADATDCDDLDSGIFPGAVEVAGDGIDNDCDGSELCFLDADGDGFGDEPTLVLPENGCTGDRVAEDGDCDDDDDTTAPGVPERCDGLDNDCDGQLPADEQDLDADGFVFCDDFVLVPGGAVGSGDCDDSRPSVHPGADEQCDGLDTDCDLEIPAEEIDGDLDGYIVCGDFVDEGIGLAGGADCSDGEPNRNPGEVESCNGIDDDCQDGVPADELDEDQDGFVSCTSTEIPGDDCDDTNSVVFPGAPEVCDGLTNDCSGAPDIGAPDFWAERDLETLASTNDFGEAMAEVLDAGGTVHMCADGGGGLTYDVNGVQAALVGHGTPVGGLPQHRFTGRLLMTQFGDLAVRGLQLEPGAPDGLDGPLLHGTIFTSLTLDDFVIDCADRPGALQGGAIFSLGVTTLRNGVVQSCTADEGGFAYLGRATLDGVEVVGCSAPNTMVGAGGAVYSTGEVTLTDSTFRDNLTWNTGGAVHAEQLAIAGSAFEMNTGNSGGAVWASRIVEIRDSAFDENTGFGNGAAVFLEDTPLDGATIENTTFFRNEIEPGQAGNGGALYLNQGVVSVSGCDFDRNVADAGGAIFLGSGALLSVDDTVLTGNVARVRGGGIRTQSDLEMSNTIFRDNVAILHRHLGYGGPVVLTDVRFETGPDADTASLSTIGGTSTLVGTNVFVEPGSEDQVTISLFGANATLDLTDSTYSGATIETVLDSTSTTFDYDGVIPSLVCFASTETCTPPP